MTITYHHDILQGSDEWHALRCGLLTASETKLIITPASLKAAWNDKVRAHVWELAAQRITRYVEPSYIGDDMLRGYEDEARARDLYSRHYAPVEECGFITNDKWGFFIGCSPDGLVGLDGGVQVKSRRQKFQVETIANGEMPDDFLIQVQTELLVTERAWWDFISYSGGLPMVTIRVLPDVKVQNAIVDAAAHFEANVRDKMGEFSSTLATLRSIPTERVVEQEMVV